MAFVHGKDDATPIGKWRRAMDQTLEYQNEHAAPSPAEIYDEQFVPALFSQFGPVLCDAANILRGQRALDVACGTGALTVGLAERALPGGAVLGLDANPQMLAVARRKRADIEWHEGRAEALPFDDASFDAVLSQFGMMFFDNAVAALREMQRVLRPGGRLAVAVCDALEHSPGYAELARLLERLFGKRIADAFRAPFALGDAARLRALCAEAGIGNARIMRHDGTVRFASIEALVSAERACVWTLGGLLDNAQFELLLRESRSVLRPYVDAGSGVAFTLPALLICAGRE
jgi:SAM-dependent methyltransferase